MNYQLLHEKIAERIFGYEVKDGLIVSEDGKELITEYAYSLDSAWLVADAVQLKGHRYLRISSYVKDHKIQYTVNFEVHTGKGEGTIFTVQNLRLASGICLAALLATGIDKDSYFKITEGGI